MEQSANASAMVSAGSTFQDSFFISKFVSLTNLLRRNILSSILTSKPRNTALFFNAAVQHKRRQL